MNSKNFPPHPWLAALFPALHLYSENLGFVRDAEAGIALATVLLLSTGLYLALSALAWDRQRAALVTTILLLGFLLHGHVALLFVERGIERPDVFLLPVLLALCAGIAWGVWRRRANPLNAQLGLTLSIVFAVLLVLPSIRIGSYWLGARGEDAAAMQLMLDFPRDVPKRSNGPGAPDVYYIVVDGYSSNAHLQREWGYDNSSFTEGLEQLGFFVANESRSNYGATLLSLGSSLNMEYLDQNSSEVSDDLVYLRSLVADSEVARQFLLRGYSYLYFLSGYLAPSRYADLNLDFSRGGVLEFEFGDVTEQSFEEDAITDGSFYRQSFYEALVNTTALRTLSDRLKFLYRTMDRPLKWSDPERFLATLERLESVAGDPSATFCFVHLLEPHAPVQFARNGERLARPLWNPKPDQFFAELEFVNERLLAMLRTILESSQTPPIVILQADHGSHLGAVWTRENPRRLTHFEILNAFHLPGGPPASLPADISPINSFRLVLNEYFDGDYELLPVRQYDIPKGYDSPFEQIDVTRNGRD